MNLHEKLRVTVPKCCYNELTQKSIANWKGFVLFWACSETLNLPSKYSHLWHQLFSSNNDLPSVSKVLCFIFWLSILWNIPGLMILNLWSCFHINQVFWAGLFSALWIKTGARSGFCIDVKEPPLLIVIYFSGKSLNLEAVFFIRRPKSWRW